MQATEVNAAPLDEDYDDGDLASELGSFAYDPVGFVMWAFPWGEKGTDLADHSGPFEWQMEILIALRDGLIDLNTAVLLAVTSGHGVGKSALVSWITWWAFSTFEGTRGVVTANTENQLKTKTWVEIAKWHRLFIAKHLFKCTATAIFSIDPETAREWRIDIVPWSERNTEAFAGLHNAGKRIIILFDEASAIPEIIWETTEGALTDKDTEIIWGCFGNPTKTGTRFHNCFPGGQFAARWTTLEVDSRDVPNTNKLQHEKWIADYGIDSDFVRVRILGKFPKSNSDSFIPRDLVEDAMERELREGQDNEPNVLGVDVARFGTDNSVLYPRKGLDARTQEVHLLHGYSVTQVAAAVIELDKITPFDMIFVDAGGVGGGVYDILFDAGVPVYPVDFGSSPDGICDGEKFLNKRSELYGLIRKFCKSGCLPTTIPKAEDKFIDVLCSPAYYINDKDKIVLESKKSMRLRGVPSPDEADALGLTLAYPVTDNTRSMGYFDYASHQTEVDFNPYDTDLM